ncbi:tyrosinase family protein [Flagellimonas meridianipacifica]|uniref:Polyphenol oxidase-like protein n=1 Tax=Flagellimonas meridianipacifica TaxID=1080225 RepID=A0A2T0MJ40_9FLAO|nr:tyrosinase family protein [Allomuricauda pacifica]PRX57608.1 polyphenol oxidase-like protein [Allomuricauda pacifica]
MKTNKSPRRDFLKTMGWSTIGLSTLPLATSSISSCQTKPTEKAQTKNSNSLAVRKNIADFAPDDPEIKLFKDALNILKKRSEVSPLDPSGWQAHGMLHATFCATSIYANQVHYNWYVWPWHRLYLWSMEQKLQKAVNEPTLALHYWDWTKAPNIPDHYWGNESNPLFNVTRMVGPENELPKDFINVGAGFRAEHYKTFGGYPAIKKRGEAQLDGLAEQSFHNNIHNWIGGQMATFTESGFDPIFYAHHGNCDRIWDAWRAYSPKNTLPEDEEWLEKRLFATDGNGTPVDFKIKDLLNTEDLGYRFNDLDLNPTYCNPYEEADKPERNASAQDCVAPLNLETSQTDAIYKEFINKERTHVILHFERAQLPYQPYCARVFFEYDKEGERQSKYTGTFTILPILDLDSVLLQNGVHLQIEIEKEIAEAIEQEKNIEVIFQPVPLPNRNIPDEILKLENISLKLNYEDA